MKLKKALAPIIFWHLKLWAKLQLFKVRPVVLGIGGASGKTSLSHFLYIILSEKYKVRQTYGKNSQTGIPLSILGLNPGKYTLFDWLRVIVLAPLRVLTNFERYEILIAELGIDSPLPPNNMSYLLSIVKPKIAALTNISYEHSENFDPLVSGKNRNKKILDLTAKEEGLILTSLPQNRWAILNIDDPEINGLKNKIKAKTITVSTKVRNAHFFGETSIDSGFRLEIRKKDQAQSFFLPKPIPLHYATSILEALAISDVLGVPLSLSLKTLKKNFSLPPGRFTIFPGIKNTKILDSSYNSSLIPAKDALFLLSKMKGRRLAVLGDMRELGSLSKNQHEDLARDILKRANLAVLIGPLMQKYVTPILKRQNFEYYSFLTFSESKKTIKELIKEKDVILVKGSQNTLYLERVVEMLLRNPKDKVLLCRRGDYWDKRRRETL